MKSSLNFITGNAHKLKEVKAMLEPDLEVRNQPLDLEEIQGTIEEVSRSKCRKAAEIVKGPVLVEDTALCFTALGGLPGPYIKWFMAAIGHQGLNNLLMAYADKSAEAVCTFAYSSGPGHEPVLFQGRCQGKIVLPRGPSDFGWDACFEHGNQTFAEMKTVDKNKVSHRGLGLAKLREWFRENQTESRIEASAAV